MFFYSNIPILVFTVILMFTNNFFFFFYKIIKCENPNRIHVIRPVLSSRHRVVVNGIIKSLQSKKDDSK